MNWRALFLLVIIVKSAVVVSFCCSNPNISSTCQTEIQGFSCCSSEHKCSDTTEIPEDSSDTNKESSSHCSCVHISPMNIEKQIVEELVTILTIEKNEVNHYVSPYYYLYSSKIFQPPRLV